MKTIRVLWPDFPAWISSDWKQLLIGRGQAIASSNERSNLRSGRIAADFSSSGIVSTIRAAQTDTIRHPEFLKRATAAGVIGYWVFLTGKKVVYFGRKGEIISRTFYGPKHSSTGTVSY